MKIRVEKIAKQNKKLRYKTHLNGYIAVYALRDHWITIEEIRIYLFCFLFFLSFFYFTLDVGSSLTKATKVHPIPTFITPCVYNYRLFWRIHYMKGME